MTDFYHVFIKPSQGITEEDLKKKFDLALDWYRYSDNNWILKTTSDAEKWERRLLSLVKPDGDLLIMRLDPDERSGWMNNSFWDWIQGKKSEQRQLDFDD